MGPDAIFDDRLEKRVVSRCPESVLPNFPVHAVLFAEKAVDTQLFEWKYAAKSKQAVKLFREEHVGVKIEAAQTIDGEISEKVIALNPRGKRVEHAPVLRKLRVNKLLDLSIIKKKIFVIWIRKRKLIDAALSRIGIASLLLFV